MSVLTAPLKFGNKPAIESVQPQRVTVAEFHQQWEEGGFEGRKAMLLDGEVIEMPNPGPPHDQALGLADYCLKAVFTAGYWVRIQQPLLLSLWTDPVPDLAVVAGSPRKNKALPKTALLVVELSDSTLSIDTGIKAALYAAASIADYWVVDLNARSLIVHRNPQVDSDSPRKSAYAEVVVYTETESVSPLAMPNVSISVAEFLPD